MKPVLFAKKSLSYFVIRKQLMICATVLLCLFIGATTYAYHHHFKTPEATTSAPAPKVEAKPTSPSPTQTIASTPVTAKTEEQPASPPTTTAPASPQKQPKTPLLAPPSHTPPPTIFTAGRIETAYTSCAGGTLYYTVGNVTISRSGTTIQNFTWQIELNDGSIYESDTDTMPSGSSVWFSFPSTPSYPSMIATIENANDGDRARIVITNPNYSAGGWSDPVPIGSEEKCHTGQM